MQAFQYTDKHGEGRYIAVLEILQCLYQTWVNKSMCEECTVMQTSVNILVEDCAGRSMYHK